MNRLPLLCATLALAAPCATAQTLSQFDVTLGLSQGTSPTELFLGHDVRFELQGAFGEVGIVLAGTTPPAFPIIIGGVAAVLDPTQAVQLGVATLDSGGAGSVSATVPSQLPAGVTVLVQAGLFDFGLGTIRLTNGLTPALASEPFTTLASGSQSAHPTAGAGGVEVIQSTAAWNAFWTQHSSFQFPPPAPPAVDFGTHAVVAVFDGTKPSSGYAITVDSITKQGAGLDVRASAVAPGFGCGVLTVITYPFHFVLVPAAVAGPATLTKTLTFIPCS